jgi:hypothetical protein
MGNGRGGWKSELGMSGWEDIPSPWVLSSVMDFYLYRTTERKRPAMTPHPRRQSCNSYHRTT